MRGFRPAAGAACPAGGRSVLSAPPEKPSREGTDTMLDAMRRGQRWLTGLFVLVLGGVFVFFMGLGQPLRSGPSQGMVVELGDIRLANADFQRVREQQAEQFRDQLGDQLDSKMGRSFLDAQALRTLVDRAILAHEAQALGLRVGNEEIERVVAQSPGFRDESGRFDSKAFNSWVEWQWGNQRNYVDFMRRLLLGQKMIRLLYSQGEVSDGEARDAALYRLEQVQIAYVALETELLPPDEKLSDEEVETYADEHEQELRAVYQERIDEFQQKERLRLRDILFELGPTATPGETSEAEAKAQKALDRLAAGEAFADVAREMSEDQASRGSGGSLGSVSPDDVDPALAAAAAKLAPGEHSGIVRTDRGLHILLLENRVEAGTRSFEEVRSELAREAATRHAASERADRLSDELATAIEQGQSLEQAARERKLPIQRTGMLRRRPDGFVVGLGASKELMATAFALSKEHASSPRIFEVGSQLVLIQLLDRKEPDEATLAEAMKSERERLAATKANAFVQSWIDERRRQLLESGQLRIDNSVVEGS